VRSKIAICRPLSNNLLISIRPKIAFCSRPQRFVVGK
jgi:hypothetical protein